MVDGDPKRGDVDAGEAQGGETTAEARRTSMGAGESGADEFGFVIDEGAWPLVYIRFPSKGLSDEGLEAFIERYDGYFARGEPFATISDARGVTVAINAHQRRRFAKWLSDVAETAGAQNFAGAVIVKSAVVRGALTAVFWMKQPAAPTKVFGSITEAAPWLLERFAAVRVAVTPAIERMLSGRV